MPPASRITSHPFSGIQNTKLQNTIWPEMFNKTLSVKTHSFKNLQFDHANLFFWFDFVDFWGLENNASGLLRFMILPRWQQFSLGHYRLGKMLGTIFSMRFLYNKLAFATFRVSFSLWDLFLLWTIVCLSMLLKVFISFYFPYVINKESTAILEAIL